MDIHADRIIAVRTSKTVYLDGETVIKVFDESYKKSDVFKEALAHSMAEERGIDVPTLLCAEPADKRWTIKTKYIRGITLAQLQKKNPEKAKEYTDLLACLQCRVLSVDGTGFPSMKQKFGRKIDLSGYDISDRLLLHKTLKKMSDPAKLCHGDFVPPNIIVGEDGKNYILDWSHAFSGNECADAAITYLWYQKNIDDTAAEYYLECFVKKTGIEKRFVSEWIPIIKL